MRIINVIVIENNEVTDLSSFGVFEEQLSNDVSKSAEEKFSQEVLKLTGMEPDEFEELHGPMDNHIENGHFELSTGTSIDSVSVVWSYI